jgi:hypothetical protein
MAFSEKAIYPSEHHSKKGLTATAPVSSVSTFSARLAAWKRGIHRHLHAMGLGTREAHGYGCIRPRMCDTAKRQVSHIQVYV